MGTEQHLIIVESFRALQDSLYRFAATYYHDKQLNAWLAPPCKPTDARQLAFKAISQLEYTEQQASKATLQQPGIVGASKESLRLIEQINNNKDQFKQVMQTLKKTENKVIIEQLNTLLDAELNKRNLQHKAILRRTGLARLNLKQCYRHIPVLKNKPNKVSWTWAHTKAIKKITVEEATQKLLKKADSPGIRHQLKRLAECPSTESLAIIQEVAPHLRANILTVDNNGNKERKMISAALPIFYPETIDQALPMVSPPGEKHPNSMHRLKRSDQKIAQEVFIPALRAHRYI